MKVSYVEGLANHDGPESWRTPMTNGRGKSDSFTVPAKSPNHAVGPAAEAMEGKELAKANLLERNASWTRRQTNAPSVLERVRQAARKDKKQRFTAVAMSDHGPYSDCFFVEPVSSNCLACFRSGSPAACRARRTPIRQRCWREYKLKRAAIRRLRGGEPSPK
jgi:hypothetical protein